MDQREFVPVAAEQIEAVQLVPAGKEATTFEPGDFILTHGDAWTSRLIRFGQGLRIHGPDRVYTHWNHAALIVDQDGGIIEALGAGVTRRSLDAYKPKEYTIVRIAADKDDRAQAVRFGRWATGEVDPATGEQLVDGDGKRVRYGWLTIASIAYSLITGGKFSFSLAGQEICSGLVARALERTGIIFPVKPPTHIMPADLAKYYGAPGPS